MCSRRVVGAAMGWLACASASEGAVLCALDAGWGCDEISWRAHLLLRVQVGAPWVRDGAVTGVADEGIRCRGCGVVRLGRGLGGLGLWLACASVAEDAGLCALGTGWGCDEIS